MRNVFLLAYAAVSALSAFSATFEIGENDFLLDGKPFVVRCGEVHYARIPRALGIRIDWFAYFASQRLGARNGGPSASRDPLADAYAVLGASANDSADELKRKYRELAKRNHPDALRAQGLPEEMVGKATERMSRINAAWATIREARGI